MRKAPEQIPWFCMYGAKLLRSNLFKASLEENPLILHVFIWFLEQVNHHPYTVKIGGKEFYIPRGSCLTSERKIAKELGQSRRKIRTVTQYLIDKESLAAQDLSPKIRLYQVKKFKELQLGGPEKPLGGPENGPENGPGFKPVEKSISDYGYETFEDLGFQKLL